jgi:hypothetical protein
MKKKIIKIPKDFFKDLKFKIDLPTFKCSCGKEVLDTPANRLEAFAYKTRSML